MIFDLENAYEILDRTPMTLAAMLNGLGPAWTASSGKQDDWAPFDVIGHLIHGEKTDWIPRAELILAKGENRVFDSFDRFAQFSESEGKTLNVLLDEFRALRMANMAKLRSWDLSKETLQLKGMHPELGEVNLEQLIATWVVHDLNHVAQIARSLAKRYSDEVGPWKEYLSILN
jgi:hypothetical protein